MVQCNCWNLEDIIKSSLVINPVYFKLPEVPVDRRKFKEYILYGDSDISPLQELLNKDLMESGNDEMSAYSLWYAVSEAVENAQEHQYKWRKYDAGRNLNEIRVFCQYTPMYDIISVQSRGSLDIEYIKKLLDNNKEMSFRRRGRGFYIMTKFCDVVNLNSDYEKKYLDVILIKMKKEATIMDDANAERKKIPEAAAA